MSITKSLGKIIFPVVLYGITSLVTPRARAEEIDETGIRELLKNAEIAEETKDTQKTNKSEKEFFEDDGIGDLIESLGNKNPTVEKVQKYFSGNIYFNPSFSTERQKVTSYDEDGVPVITNTRNSINELNTNIELEPRISYKRLQYHGVLNTSFGIGSGKVAGDDLNNLNDFDLEIGAGVKSLDEKLRGLKLDIGYNKNINKFDIATSDSLVGIYKSTNLNGLFSRVSFENLPLNSRVIFDYVYGRGKAKETVDMYLSKLGLEDSSEKTKYNVERNMFNISGDTYPFDIRSHKLGFLGALGRDVVNENGNKTKVDSISAGINFEINSKYFSQNGMNLRAWIYDSIKYVTVDNSDIRLNGANTLNLGFDIEFGKRPRRYK
ncbi:MAG: hypothetical protein AB1571_01560 [Nanoarchaeota archaeon]